MMSKEVVVVFPHQLEPIGQPVDGYSEDAIAQVQTSEKSTNQPRTEEGVFIGLGVLALMAVSVLYAGRKGDTN